MRVYKHLDRSAEPERFLAWLVRIARNAGVDHLRRRRARPPAQDVPVEDAHFLAAFFSGLVPGLGQVYVGYYQRGFVNVMIFAALITMLASGAASGMETLIAIPMVFFYLYNIIDASRRASLYNLALQGAQQRALELPEIELPSRRSSLGGGILLIAVGLLLFLNVRFEFSLDWLRDWWPLAIMGLGVYLVVQWRQANVARERDKRM